MPRRHNRQKYQKPSWYDLNKYEILKSIPLEGWYHELSARQQIIEKNMGAGLDDDTNKLPVGFIFEDIVKNYIRKNGSVLGLFYPVPQPECPEEIQPDKEWIENGLKTGCVRLSTCRDVARLQLEDHIVEACTKSISIDHEIEAHVPYDIYAISHIDDNQKAELNLTINLNAPNSVLVKDFEDVLSAARDHLDVQSKTLVSDSRIAKWLSQQLVPYLDLYIWMQETGDKVPLDIISGWLYPDLYENEDNNPEAIDEARKVQRTTHVKAMKLVSDEFLANLEAVIESQSVFMTSNRDFELHLCNLFESVTGTKKQPQK